MADLNNTIIRGSLRVISDFYADTIYEGGTALSDKYLQLSGGTMSGNITLGSGASGQTQVGANLIMGIQNDSYGLLPYSHNWNQIGADGRYWYRAFISNIYATTIYENGTSLVDKYLGINSNAVSASVPYGFSGRTTSAGWTSAMNADGYTNMITGWSDSYSGDIAFKDNGSGALSCEIDGYFYQGCDGHGSSRVMDNYDRTHLQWGDADTLDGYHASAFLNTSGGTIGGNLTLTTSSSVALKVLVNQPQGLQGEAYAKLTTTDDSYPEGRLELADYAGSVTKYTPSGIIIGSYKLSYPSLSANRTIATTADITTVVANPSGSATATLSSIQIGSTVYSLPTPSGSSGISSIGGATGAITLGTGLTMSNNTLSTTGLMGINGGLATSQFNLLGHPNADLIIRSQGQSNTVIGADVGGIILITNVSNGGSGVLLDTNSVSNYYYASFPNKSANSTETIAMVSDIPSSLPANGGNADTVDSEHASAFAHIGQDNVLTAHGNEFNFAPDGFSGDMYLNYRCGSGNANGAITSYLLGNGAGGVLGTIIHSGNIGNQSVNYASSAGSAGSASYADYITSHDTRNSNPTPQEEYKGLKATFQANSSDGLYDGGGFHGVLHFRSYGDNGDLTGGYPIQIAYTANGNLWTRMGASSSTWDSWTKLTRTYVFYDIDIEDLDNTDVINTMNVGDVLEFKYSNNDETFSVWTLQYKCPEDTLDFYSYDFGNSRWKDALFEWRSNTWAFIETNVYRFQAKDADVADNVAYLTTAPTSANTSGQLKFVVLSSEPSTKYSGYVYLITG